MKRLACAMAVALAVTSCGGEESDYSYFAVDITLDRATIDDDLLKTIVGCTMFVWYMPNAGESQMIDSGDLRCSPGTTKYNLGRAEWSTRQAMGGVKFVVTMHDFSNQVIASGASRIETIVPKRDVTTTVVVMAPVRQMTPDGGAPDGGSLDVRADSATEARPPDGGAPDGNLDTLGIGDSVGN